VERNARPHAGRLGTTRRRRLRRALTPALVAILVAAGCGDDDDAAPTTPDQTTAAGGTAAGGTAAGQTTTAGETTVAGQSTDAGDEVTLRVSWWGSDARHEATIAAIEEFENAYPNVTVEPEFSGFEGYNDRLATQAAGGNAPDVFQVDPSAVSEYADRGVMVNLDDYVGNGLSLDAIPENVSDLGRTPDGLFSLPWGLTAPILMVREDLLFGTEGPQEGWSWEDFEQWAGEINEASGGDVHGSEDLGHRDDALRVWLRQQGKEFYTEDGQLAFERDDLVEWFTMWDRMRESGGVPSADVSAQWDGTPENSALTSGQTAAEFAYTSVQQGFADVAGVPLTAVRPPGNSETPGDYLRPSVFLSAYSGSEHPEEAVQFIDFMLNNPDAGGLLGASRGVPPNEETRELVRSDADEAALAELDYIADHVDSFGPPPPLPPAGGFEIIELLRRVYESVSFGQQDVEAAADEFFTEAEGVLGQ
jgi:multiple sugar transport system substrate-binding protein